MRGEIKRGDDRRKVYRRSHEEDDRNYTIINKEVERRRAIRRGLVDRRAILESSFTETVAAARERRAQNGG